MTEKKTIGSKKQPPRRDWEITLRLTEEELSLLEARAKRAHMTKAEYMRTKILGGKR